MGIALTYPLTSVQVLRDQEEDAARRALASAIEQHTASVAAREAAERHRLEHERATEVVQRDEAVRDASGRSVAETLTAQAYLSRRKRELTALVAEITARRDDEAARARDVEAARATLAQARAEVEALAKHRKGWEAEQAKVLERREEAELDDRASRRR